MVKVTPSKNFKVESCVGFRMIAASQRWATRLTPTIVRSRQQSTLNEGLLRQPRCLLNQNLKSARNFETRGDQSRGREGHAVTQEPFSSQPSRLHM